MRPESTVRGCEESCVMLLFLRQGRAPSCATSSAIPGAPSIVGPEHRRVPQNGHRPSRWARSASSTRILSYAPLSSRGAATRAMANPRSTGAGLEASPSAVHRCTAGGGSPNLSWMWLTAPGNSASRPPRQTHVGNQAERLATAEPDAQLRKLHERFSPKKRDRRLTPVARHQQRT